MYDSIIIGTGPAGVSAALNLKILNRNFLWIGSRNLSGKIAKAELVRNYPGLPDLPGAQLNEAFKAHVAAMGIDIHEAMVNMIAPMKDHFGLTAGADFFETKTVILTTGVAAAGTLPGEEALLGRGVSYCATCDGGLYRGRTIAALVSSPRFEHEVKYLAGLAAKVYFLPGYKGASAIAENVETLSDRAAAVEGGERVTGVKLAAGQVVPVDGVFCLRESISLSTLLPKLALEEGHIAVDRRMATNLPGVFAAGDCTGRPYQYAKAVGEGNVAAHSAAEYLAAKEDAR
ncbi:MAG: NAD(P)/FAD-dependent oxidoreductase [Clostridia bacterium]|nr:NAD(P)/FAD-dependent oxidoreductase [Clostridia bacterium]